MIMFFKKRSIVNLTKLYFSPHSLNEQVNLSAIATTCFDARVWETSRVSLNYGKEFDSLSWQKKNLTLEYKDLEYLIVVDADAQLILTIGIAFSQTNREPIFECVLVTPADPQFSHELVFFEKFASWFTLYYGYSRALGCDHFPSTERKIRKGLLGQTAIVGKLENDWLINPVDIRIGAVKGVYPINFWREQAISKLRDIGLQLPMPHNVIGNLHVFSKSDQAQVSRENAQFRKYLHFSDSATDS
jgi:hypothetical protein